MKQLRLKTCLTVIIAFMAIMAVTISGCTKAKEKESEVLMIGAILPLTGEAALYGNNDREGIDLAVEMANKQGGINGSKITVLYEDNVGEAKHAVSAINKLSLKDVPVIIDDAISTVTLGILPIATEKKIIILSTGATNPSLSGASPYFYRIWNSDTEEGFFAASALFNKLNIKKTAVVYVNNDYGKGLRDVFIREYTSIGGNIITEETFGKTNKNYRDMVAKIKQARPDAIYLIGYAPETGIIVKQLREANVKAQIFGTVAIEDPVFIKLAGNASEGVVYVFPKAPVGLAVDEFKKSFNEKYGKEPGLLCDVGYDAANLVIDAYRKGARTSDDIRKVFANLKNYKGASGEIAFDENGDVHKPMVLKIIKNGNFASYMEDNK